MLTRYDVSETPVETKFLLLISKVVGIACVFSFSSLVAPRVVTCPPSQDEAAQFLTPCTHEIYKHLYYKVRLVHYLKKEKKERRAFIFKPYDRPYLARVAI